MARRWPASEMKMRVNAGEELSSLHHHELLNMNEQFELIYGFVHCRGKTTYSAGFVDTEVEAEAWVRNHREGSSPKIKIPIEDPIRYCQAALCPFKRQKPWFAFIPPR